MGSHLHGVMGCNGVTPTLMGCNGVTPTLLTNIKLLVSIVIQLVRLLLAGESPLRGPFQNDHVPVLNHPIVLSDNRFIRTGFKCMCPYHCLTLFSSFC